MSSVSPDIFHQGESFRFTFSLINKTTSPYDDVYVFCHSVKNNGDTWTQPVNRASGAISLAAGASGDVTVDAIVPMDQTLGNHTLSYYVHYADSIDEYRTPDYSETVAVEGANQDVTATVSPDAFGPGESGQFTFFLENHSPSPYEDVYVFCYSVDKDGETWTQPVNQASAAVTVPGGGTEDVTVDAETAGDQAPGTYTLSYYIHFTATGDREFHTPYEKTVTVSE